MAIVQKSNYIPNTLRKGRAQAFEADIQRVYNKYYDYSKSILPQQFTVQIFSQIWSSFNMQYIFQCLCEEQSEDQFAQLLYEVTIKKYFLFKSKLMRIFSLFSLYFLYYACQNRKRILISNEYAQDLKIFLLLNRNDNACHYIKITYHLHQKCFNLSTKIGLRNPIVKDNGQLPRKAPIVKTDPLGHMLILEDQLKSQQIDQKSLKQTLATYDKLKNSIKDASYNKQKFPLDIYFTNRVEKLIKNYKQFIVNVQREKKKQQDNE